MCAILCLDDYTRKELEQTKKVTLALSDTEENQVRDTRVIGTTNPAALLNATFFYNGKNFCLRGGVEHCGLKLSQRTVSNLRKKVNGYVYTEHGSKNNQGGLSSLNQGNKIVHPV